MRIRRNQIQWLSAAFCAWMLLPGMQGQKRSAPAPRAVAPARPAMHPTTATPNHNVGAANHPGASRTTASAHSEGMHPGAVHPVGVRTAGGGTRVARPDGGSEFHGAHGEQAHFDRAGHVREIRSGNVRIEHRPGGMRHIEVERADHSRMVMDGRGRGYIQRPYMYRGHAFYHRDYYANGVRYSRFYRPYYYHNVYLTGYMPARYYAPGFYGWAYAPWGPPVAYAWGWGAAPWYGYYGPYFAPYPVYPSASLWLTDYLIAQSLQDAYQQGAAAGAAGYAQLRDGNPIARGMQGAHLVYASYSPNGAWDRPTSGAGATVLTPQIKQLIANEVQAGLAAKQSAAQNAGADSASTTGSLAQLLNEGQPHVFVVSTAVSTTTTGQDCALTEGDVLQSGAAPAANATSVDLTVLASKKKDCGKGSLVSVSLEDLQEMQNHLMATLDQGLDELSTHAGKDGLPAAPAGLTPQTDAPYASGAPASDPNIDQELAQGEQEANQTEQAVLNQAAPGLATGQAAGSGAGDTPRPAVAPVTIALGQTPAQVTANKGAPKQIVNLGARQIYVYSDMKIYFVSNKVSDVK
jgi:hypothetical protein